MNSARDARRPRRSRAEARASRAGTTMCMRGRGSACRPALPDTPGSERGCGPGPGIPPGRGWTLSSALQTDLVSTVRPGPTSGPERELYQTISSPPPLGSPRRRRGSGRSAGWGVRLPYLPAFISRFTSRACAIDSSESTSATVCQFAPCFSEPAESLLQVVWTAERLFHLHLLIENEADQQGQMIGLEELIRLRYIGPYDRHN